jgi:hypothetical protein
MDPRGFFFGKSFERAQQRRRGRQDRNQGKRRKGKEVETLLHFSWTALFFPFFSQRLSILIMCLLRLLLPDDTTSCLAAHEAEEEEK